MEKLWEKIKKSVVEGVTFAAEKTEEITKLGKAKLDILGVKRKISKNFTELGGLMYDAIKDGKAEDVLKSSELEVLVSSVKDLEKELREKEEEFENLKKKVEPEEKVESEEKENKKGKKKPKE